MNCRTCTTCNVEQFETEFRVETHRGKLRRMNECRECNRARQRRYWHQRSAPQVKVWTPDPLNTLANRWRGRVNRKEPLRWRA